MTVGKINKFVIKAVSRNTNTGTNPPHASMVAPNGKRHYWISEEVGEVVSLAETQDSGEAWFTLRRGRGIESWRTLCQ
jgi:hypothetical protein